MSTTFHTSSEPHWHDGESMSTWECVKEAIRRDWEQTRYGLGLSGGHQLNQHVGDTLRQAAKSVPIPARDQANPAKVIGTWSDDEYPVGYGYTARPRAKDTIVQRLRANLRRRTGGHAGNENRTG